MRGRTLCGSQERPAAPTGALDSSHRSARQSLGPPVAPSGVQERSAASRSAQSLPVAPSRSQSLPGAPTGAPGSADRSAQEHPGGHRSAPASGHGSHDFCYTVTSAAAGEDSGRGNHDFVTQ